MSQNDMAILLTAVATLITAITAFLSVVINGRRIKNVATEVKTANGLSLAQLGDAGETRRIDEIPVKDRTRQEKKHIKVVDTPPQKG